MITVVGGKEVYPSSWTGETQPYVCLRIGNEIKETAVAVVSPANPTPTWLQSVMFVVPHVHGQQLAIEMLNGKQGMLLGRAVMKLDCFGAGKQRDVSVDLLLKGKTGMPAKRGREDGQRRASGGISLEE